MRINDRIYFKLDGALPVLIIMALFAVRFFSQLANNIMLNYLMPVLMVWCVVKDKTVLRNNIIFLYICLLIWMFFTVFTGHSIERSLVSIRPTMGGLITSVVMYSLSRKSVGNATWLLLSYIVLYLSSMLFLYLTGAIYNLDVERSRLSVSALNANDLAYYLFYVTIVISLVFWNGYDKMNTWNIIIYVILVLFTLYTSIITASRQVLVVVLPFIILSILFRMKGRRRVSVGFIFGISIFFIVSLFVYRVFMNDYVAGSYLEYRMQLDVGDDSRVDLLKRAFILGLQHPIFGVGPGNFEIIAGGGNFSHCSYTELFATSGLLAMILFVAIVYKSMKLHYKRYKKTKNSIFLYLFIATMFWAIYNFFFAFYISPWLMSFLFLMNGYSEITYKHIQYESA